VSVRVGVLHTVPALVPVFHGLLTERRDDLDIVHVADPSLLSRAVAAGITDDVAGDLRRHVAALRDSGAGAVLVTCSSIGEAATDAAAAVGVPLVRVDAAMADEAAERAGAGRETAERAGAGRGRILVLATLEATLGPTSRLVQSAASGSDVEVTARVVADAAAARASGDLARHDQLIAEAIAAAGDVDVIVLAQASMATGAGDDPRVLTSPASGAARFVESLADR
jgi:hypothetical protein